MASAVAATADAVSYIAVESPTYTGFAPGGTGSLPGFTLP